MNQSNDVPTHGIDVSSLTRKGERRKLEDEEKVFQVKDLNLYYGEKQALHAINMAIPKQRVTAYIGPSGCGKSTLLRCLNRMNDLVDNVRIEGEIQLDGNNIY